ncbi:type I polyketide synthase [Paenibacillus oleatilyticus]|uniref:Beta-ketoacyl synthase N-terminal-like domain-containing protein n=1 Tax=Paenibacillus oleatilyticus TaxID=2594886 RepID=A0ABV4VA49_9BACL
MDELQSQFDAVAIIGMAGRFPGACNVREFWDNLLNSRESITFFSKEELLKEGIPSSLLDDPFYVYARGILDNIDLFDADFFGMTPREAELTDPQHRLFMESCWEALEDAGYDPERYPHRIGVFAGESLNSYLLEHVYPYYKGAIGLESLQMAIGNDKDSLTTSVSYRMNLRGPAITVQTSSSTSLTAIALACQSLLHYQCDMALAGGAAVGAQQKTGYLYQEGGIMSRDGHCRAFDARSSGFVTGSGVGTVLLKRLEDALRDQDHIYAVIKGYAINNDGSNKISYAAPSVEGQAEVIAEALACAGVDADSVGYVEAHGTGTPMGDSVEWTALTLAFGLQTEKQRFCAIGSVKTNIGHLDTAAGVAGLIKTALALKYGKIPASLHFQTPNPHIDMENTPFYVNSTLRDWPQRPTPRRAGVSSLGMGGTNVHVVMEEAPAMKYTEEVTRPRLLLLSARTVGALEAMTANLADYIAQNPDINMNHVAYTLQAGRKQFAFRRSLVCRDAATAVQRLREHHNTIAHFDKSFSTVPQVVFMFGGQGTQYVNMARGLYETEAVVRDTVRECSDILKHLMGLRLESILYPKTDTETQIAEECIHQTYIAQPTIFVVGYAMARLWISRGIEPSFVIGHSIGEYVAACLAGVFTLEDALKVVTARGQLMQELQGGAMLAVGLTEAEVKEMLEEGHLSLAAVNSPSLCVLSGEYESIQHAQHVLESKGVFCSRLKTSHAFHSYMMDPVLDRFREVIQTVSLTAPVIPLVSNVTGQLVKNELLNEEYWVTHLRQTVKFGAGVSELLKQPNIIFLEVGAGEILSSLVVQQLSHEQSDRVMSSIRSVNQKAEDAEYSLETAGKLWCQGIMCATEAFHQESQRYRIPLPAYPFERQSHWLEAKRSYIGQNMSGDSNDCKVHSTRMESALEVQGQTEAPSYKKRPNLSTPFEKPGFPVQRQIAALVEELLGIAPIGVHDHFFELGGNSLVAAQLISRIQKHWNVQVSFQNFYNEPTVFHIARHIEQFQQPTDDAEVDRLLMELDELSLEEAESLLQRVQIVDVGGTRS